MQTIITNTIRQNPDHMRELKLKQVRYEKDTWKRLVHFMMEENICLKNRLSDVLKEPFNYNWLEQLERFQTRFIKTDKLMDLFFDDLAEIEHLLVTGRPGEDKTLMNMQTKLLILRNAVTNAEREFINLKLDFNGYLSDNI